MEGTGLCESSPLNNHPIELNIVDGMEAANKYFKNMEKTINEYYWSGYQIY